MDKLEQMVNDIFEYCKENEHECFVVAKEKNDESAHCGSYGDAIRVTNAIVTAAMEDEDFLQLLFMACLAALELKRGALNETIQ